MDPTVNLEQQLREAKAIAECDKVDHAVTACPFCADDAARLAQLVISLDEWIRKGGALPTQWKR